MFFPPRPFRIFTDGTGAASIHQVAAALCCTIQSSSFGFSKLCMGARTLDSAANHNLRASDFARLKHGDFDKWKPLTDNKLETLPKDLPTMSQWEKCAISEA